MDNSKKSVHSSGPLGKLMQTGQIKKINLEDEIEQGIHHYTGIENLKVESTLFRTESGIKFRENELVFVDPEECESWEYANRSDEEMGKIEELMISIKENTQLQPAMVRLHPNPVNKVKYQVIFGRRRLEACKRLGIPFLVIKKGTLSNQEAIACQDAENKYRADVSNFSNALLYRRLLNDRIFANEKDLAEKLKIPPSSLNELMSFTKIPEDILNKIPNIHNLPVYMAVKIAKLASQSAGAIEKLLDLAPKIGSVINTPSKLEHAFISNNEILDTEVPYGTYTINDTNGKKLASFKIDHKGIPTIKLSKDIIPSNAYESFCNNLRKIILESNKFGRPNLAGNALDTD